jgi:hypothetical protein
MLIYNNIKFDDYTVKEGGTYWTQICKPCVDNHKINDNLISDCSSMPICGVLGCDNRGDEETDMFYIDFPKGEAREVEN